MQYLRNLFGNGRESGLTGLFLAIFFGTYLLMEVFSFRFFNLFGTVHHEKQDLQTIHTIYHK